MPTPLAIIRQGERAENHRPWPRFTVTADAWRQVASEIAAGQATLLGLWADRAALPTIHMAVMADADGDIAVASLACPDGRYPSVGALHPPAIRLERAIQSLYGYVAIGLPDLRPWLDLGFWTVQHPLGGREEAAAVREAYRFLPVEGESLHQIPVGPVHAGIIEPGHFRFTAGGETVVRLEERLGYVHKGIESLMTGAPIAQAAKLAARTSGDSTVAYSIAFAHAVEAALGIEPPPRAQFLRALMAELERLANHLGDIGAICNDASFSLMHAHCGILREHVLRAANDAFGHRLTMDRVVPGGIAADLNRDGVPRIREQWGRSSAVSAAGQLYDNTASPQDRTAGTGIKRPSWRGSSGGRLYRPRQRTQFRRAKDPGYPPYDRLTFTVPVLTAGDVNARVWIRIREVEQSIALIGQILDRLPDGPIANALDEAAAEAKVWASPRASAATCWFGCAWMGARLALSPARSVLVSVAASGSGGGRQYRCRFPALQ